MPRTPLEGNERVYAPLLALLLIVLASALAVLVVSLLLRPVVLPPPGPPPAEERERVEHVQPAPDEPGPPAPTEAPATGPGPAPLPPLPPPVHNPPDPGTTSGGFRTPAPAPTERAEPPSGERRGTLERVLDILPVSPSEVVPSPLGRLPPPRTGAALAVRGCAPLGLRWRSSLSAWSEGAALGT